MIVELTCSAHSTINLPPFPFQIFLGRDDRRQHCQRLLLEKALLISQRGLCTCLQCGSALYANSFCMIQLYHFVKNTVLIKFRIDCQKKGYFKWPIILFSATAEYWRFLIKILDPSATANHQGHHQSAWALVAEQEQQAHLLSVTHSVTFPLILRKERKI